MEDIVKAMFLVMMDHTYSLFQLTPKFITMKHVATKWLSLKIVTLSWAISLMGVLMHAQLKLTLLVKRIPKHLLVLVNLKETCLHL